MLLGNKCPECGEKVSPDDKYCNTCGHLLDKSETTEIEEELFERTSHESLNHDDEDWKAHAKSDAHEKKTYERQHSKDDREGKKSNNIIIILLVLGIVFALALGLFIAVNLLGNSGNEPPITDSQDIDMTVDTTETYLDYTPAEVPGIYSGHVIINDSESGVENDLIPADIEQPVPVTLVVEDLGDYTYDFALWLDNSNQMLAEYEVTFKDSGMSGNPYLYYYDTEGVDDMYVEIFKTEDAFTLGGEMRIPYNIYGDSAVFKIKADKTDGDIYAFYEDLYISEQASYWETEDMVFYLDLYTFEEYYDNSHISNYADGLIVIGSMETEFYVPYWVEGDYIVTDLQYIDDEFVWGFKTDSGIFILNYETYEFYKYEGPEDFDYSESFSFRGLISEADGQTVMDITINHNLDPTLFEDDVLEMRFYLYDGFNPMAE